MCLKQREQAASCVTSAHKHTHTHAFTCTHMHALFILMYIPENWTSFHSPALQVPLKASQTHYNFCPPPLVLQSCWWLVLLASSNKRMAVFMAEHFRGGVTRVQLESDFRNRYLHRCTNIFIYRWDHECFNFFLCALLRIQEFRLYYYTINFAAQSLNNSWLTHWFEMWLLLIVF